MQLYVSANTLTKHLQETYRHKFANILEGTVSDAAILDGVTNKANGLHKETTKHPAALQRC